MTTSISTTEPASLVISDPIQDRAVVAVYETHTAAEAAIKALQQAGLDMKRLSIVGRDFQTEEHAIGYYTSGDRMKFWGGRGLFWGTLWGMLFGGALFMIPTVGPIVVMGPLIGWVVGALEGAAVGGAAGVIAAAFTNMGIPKDSVIRYETEVRAGHFIVLASGTPDMITHAHAILGTTGAAQLMSHTPLLA